MLKAARGHTPSCSCAHLSTGPISWNGCVAARCPLLLDVLRCVTCVLVLIVCRR
jgi:hypothetical protein